jgi:formate/nitrite transporter FocA (FNT family)
LSTKDTYKYRTKNQSNPQKNYTMALNIMADIRKRPSTDLNGALDDPEAQEPLASDKTPTNLETLHANATHEQMVAMLAAASRTPGTKAPKEALKAVYSVGLYKAGLPLDILFLQSFMAGLYIAMAGQLLLSAGGGILGAVLFPTGLIAVVLTSGELFTGDALVFVTSLLGGKVTWKQMARNWTVAWIGNFCGALAWAVLIAYLSDALEDKGVRDLAVHLAQKKAFQPWLHIFLKGIGANAMVCLGIWQATCAEEVAGKILAIWYCESILYSNWYDAHGWN